VGKMYFFLNEINTNMINSQPFNLKTMVEILENPHVTPRLNNQFVNLNISFSI